jgi:hypothetical protein
MFGQTSVLGERYGMAAVTVGISGMSSGLRSLHLRSRGSHSRARAHAPHTRVRRHRLHIHCPSTTATAMPVRG